MKKLPILFFIILSIFLVGCREEIVTEEKYPLKQLINHSTQDLHGGFLSGSSSTNESYVRFFYIKNGGINFGVHNMKFCQIFEDVDFIEEAYVTMQYVGEGKSSPQKHLKYRPSSDLELFFHIPKNSIQNFIDISVKN